MKITSFRGKTAMLSTEIMEKNEQLGNIRPRQGTVPCPICAGYDVIAVQYCDGKWDFGQRIFGSLSASFTQILELGGGFDAFRDFDGNADFVGWLIYNNKRESWTLWSVSGYPIFLGGNLEIGFDLNQFYMI